jgi:hypothetical protein
VAYEGNRYAGLNRKGPEDKAGWLGAAGTVAGAGLGLLAGPGGMAAGAKLGGALGGVTHDAVNGTLTPQSAMGDVAQGVAGFNGLNTAMDTRSIIEAFMRNPHQFRVGFNTGGLVTGGGAMDQLLQMLQRQNASGSPSGMGVPSGPTQTPQGPLGASSDVLGAIPGQVQQMIGRGPDLPQMESLQQASHPNWEAASSVLAQLLAAVPKPANPRNTKAIGAWAPALGVLAGAPADIAAGRRKSANADITTRNETRRLDYEKRKTAYDAQYGTLSNTLAGNATKPFAERASDATISLDMAKQLGHPEWAGLTESQARLKMQGAPDKPKPDQPQDPVKYRQYVRVRMNQDMNIKPFIKVRDSFNVIDRLARNANAASDLSMIFAYMKILDPDSVVREGEQATAENARGISDGLRNLYNKVKDGVKLTPLQRANYRKEAVNMMLARLAGIRETMDSFNAEAELAGVDISPVTRQFSRYASPEYEAELTRSMGATTPTTETDNGVTPKGVPLPTKGERKPS